MMQLNKDSLGSHLPVDSKTLPRQVLRIVGIYSDISKEALTLRPDRTGSIEGLQLNCDEIIHLAIVCGH